MQKQDNSKIKELLKNLLRIIAKPGELDDLKGGNPKELKTEVIKNESGSHDSGINATASGAPSVGSSPAFFVTETDFAHLAATLLSMVNESHHSLLSCLAIPQPPVYVQSDTSIFVSLVLFSSSSRSYLVSKNALVFLISPFIVRFYLDSIS